MDPHRKATLDLIELAVAHVSVAVRGKQLIAVVKDYIEDGDVRYARTVLARIDFEYFTDHLYKDAAEDNLFAEALAIVIDTFGVELQMAIKKAGQA